MDKGSDTLDLYPMAQSMAQNCNIPIKKGDRLAAPPLRS